MLGREHEAQLMPAAAHAPHPACHRALVVRLEIENEDVEACRLRTGTQDRIGREGDSRDPGLLQDGDDAAATDVVRIADGNAFARSHVSRGRSTVVLADAGAIVGGARVCSWHGACQ